MSLQGQWTRVCNRGKSAKKKKEKKKKEKY